jgi:hypothetical protein
MATIQRVVCEWTGSVGLPGYTVLYGDTATPSVVTDVLDFFDDIKAVIPSTVTVTVPSSGDLIDDTDGSLAGVWSGSEGGQVTGTSGADFAAGVGATVTWDTNGVRNRRRVRGRTFLAPLTSAVFDPDGTLEGSWITTLQNAADLVVAGGHLKVWSRPSSIPAADGFSSTVTSARIIDRATALRSRRF